MTNTEHPTPTLEMRGITRSFGPLRALDRVDLTLRAGEIHGLLGENGAGKSTLMNVLAGMIRPDAGQVNVCGRPLRPGSPRESAALGIGLVHQHFSLVPALTAAENLTLAVPSGPAFFRRSATLAAQAQTIAGRLGWGFDPDTPVWQLPVGQQQRLEILKVLQRDAQWLLFDEPTAVLSPAESEELFTVLEQLRAEGRGIVFISHKLREVLRLCDRVTVLRRGRNVGERARGVTSAELGALMVGERAPTLIIRNLRVREDRGTEAVRGLSLEVQQGEILGIAGVDGNGQAELAESILGLRRVASGSIALRTGAVSSGAVERPGYIPGDRRRAGLVLPMSVRENLVLEIHAAARFRWGPVLRLAPLWATARAMARRFDVRVADEKQPAATLSGGNQQKIVIARALSGERSLLVTVNPTRGLDVGATQSVHAQLRAARASGVGVLLISTDLDEVLELSDRVGVLFEGRLQAVVAPSESRERIGQMMGGVSGGAAAESEATNQS